VGLEFVGDFAAGHGRNGDCRRSRYRKGRNDDRESDIRQADLSAEDADRGRSGLRSSERRVSGDDFYTRRAGEESGWIDNAGWSSWTAGIRTAGERESQRNRRQYPRYRCTRFHFYLAPSMEDLNRRRCRAERSSRARP